MADITPCRFVHWALINLLFLSLFPWNAYVRKSVTTLRNLTSNIAKLSESSRQPPGHRKILKQQVPAEYSHPRYNSVTK